MKKENVVSIFFLAALLVLISGTSLAKAEWIPVQTELRVGLTALYHGKDSLTINNEKVGYGYCIGNRYLQEVELTSQSGFTFTPISGYFVSENVSYGSYAAANQAADKYRELGIEAYPGSVYQCKWRVYLGNASNYSEAEILKQSIFKKTGQDLLEILPGSSYRVMVKGDFGQLLIDIDEHFAYPQFRPLTVYKDQVRCIDMGSRVYRGRMEIGRYGKATLTAVNIVPIEEYLYGVVPSEMSSAWPMEALKAQAVCARSYALIKAGYGGASNAKSGYNIVDTTSSQVYKGFLTETTKTNQAVDRTRGEMVCYKDKVVAAYFSSTSGGRTEASADVWLVNLPYLQSVPDLYEYDPNRETWMVKKSKQELSAILEEAGKSVGTLTEMAVVQYSDSGRAENLNIKGSRGFLTMRGNTIRSLLNLYSTKFKIIKQGDIPDQVTVLGADQSTTERISKMYIASAEGIEKASTELEQYVVLSSETLSNYPGQVPSSEEELLFAGMGYGHGVGMSQYGAKGMAEAGYTYKEIIEYYFTGAKVK